MSLNLGPSGPAPSAEEKAQIRSAIGAFPVTLTGASAPVDNTTDATAVGQRYRAGATPPYTWYRAITAGEGTSTWEIDGGEELTDTAIATALGYTPADAADVIDPAALTFAGVDPNGGGPIGTHNGQLLHCTGTTPDSWWKWLTDTWILETENTSTILDKLKGAAADPSKIGAEFLPDSLELDYITLGEAGEVELPQGTLTRDGNVLQMFNEAGIPRNIVPDSIPAQENVIPYHRVSGRCLCIPAGQPGSTARVSSNGTVYWQELFRIKVAKEDVAAGKVLYLKAKTRNTSPAAIPNQKRVLLIPTSSWDLPQLNSGFNSLTYASAICFRAQATGSGTDVLTYHEKYYPITYAAPFWGFAAPTIIKSELYTFTPTPAATTQADSLASAYVLPNGEEWEFVGVVLTSATAANYVELAYDVTMYICDAPPAPPSGLTATLDGVDVDLAWTDASSNETAFELYRTPTIDQVMSYHKVADILPNAVTYTEAAVPAGTWYYHIRSVNGDVKSAFISSASIVVP